MNHNLTMSSLEIAELTDKEHKNVLADIREMFDALNLAADFSAATYENRGKQYPCYNLDKDMTLTLIAGYDVKLRYAIVQRWRELEEAVTPAVVPMSPMELIEFQYKRLKELEPKAEAHDRFMSTDNTRSLGDVAKTMGLKPVQFNKQLHADGYIFKRTNTWEPYAHHVEAGLFTVTIGEKNGKNYKQTRVTPLGITKLSERYA